MYTIEKFTVQLRRGRVVRVRGLRTSSLEEARDYANQIFNAYGIVVAITKGG